MAAINTTVKKKRSPGPQNQQHVFYYGSFAFPLAAGNYHLWDIPPRVRIISGYVDLDVPAGSAQNGILSLKTTTDVAVVAGAENISGTIAAGGGATLFPFATGWTAVIAPTPPTGIERYVLVWNREVAVTGNGETLKIHLVGIRDDLT